MNSQLKYIEYVAEFAKSNKIHIWLGGSFLNGNATSFSDVDISVFCCRGKLNDFIYGYGEPVYISYTSNPLGILIVIYADGVAVDLEIVEKVDVEDGVYFHREDIKKLRYIREEKLCRKFAINNDISYQISRLFHRSLIKFLAGKKNIGVVIANEIVTFMELTDLVNENDYKAKFIELMKIYDERYGFQNGYYKLLCELIEKLDKTECVLM
ncbi:MAG: nucleotidyltransferase domain-containing protein [Lachnospiraceae bacterium]|nr:nucleotidyltransferase domain-containing protein [Lachnospiraceae bacterium]